MADLTKTVKDAFYVTLGLGVIAFQRAQVQRRELAKQLESQLGDTREQVERLARDLEDRLEPIVDQLEDRLPDQARDLVKQARATAKDVQAQLLALVNRQSTNGTRAAA